MQISGALVKMSDAPKGVTERMLRLTGFPEQVQAALNLVQVGVWPSHLTLTLQHPFLLCGCLCALTHLVGWR